MSRQNGYGTTEVSVPSNVAGADEEQPLLLNGRPKALAGSLRRKLNVDISRDWADVVLVLCYLITGLLDSASISIWGSFVSMQTGMATAPKPAWHAVLAHTNNTCVGNTVYIGLGLAAPTQSTRWIKSGTSLGCFCIGSFVFSRFHRHFSPKRRWVLCASFAFQFTLIVIAAVLVTWGPPSVSGSDEIGWNVLVPIALVAFQSCGQAVASRALKYNALTSVVLTSIYCDLFSDADLFKWDNAERNRRVAAPVLLLIGAILGGLFAHSSMGIAGALWVAAVLKLFAVIAWFFWPEKTD